MRGHRVEVTDIEASLRAHPAVREAIVAMVDDGPSPEALATRLSRRSPEEVEAMIRRFEERP